METPEEWVAVPVGIVVALSGLGFVTYDSYYAGARVGIFPVTPSGVILFCAALGTVLAGAWLLLARPANEHVLRLLVWWAGGMALTLFMSTALLHNQSQRGVSLVAPFGVRLNSVTVGSTGGLLFAYLYTKAEQNAEALAEEHDRLRREQERLGVLHRMIRHDIRNDMAVALGWSDLLGETASEDQREILDRIRTANEHVVELTELSRNYVAVIVDDDSMELKPIGLAEVLRMELRTCREVYPNAAFTLRTDLPSVCVTANELLSSVFRNVLHNAVQHNDTEAPEVEVAVTQRDDVVRVAISDNGPGVPDERKEVVFGKSEQGIESAGTGIGLYVVNVFVTEYGGSVWIEDNDPTGATVVVELTRSPPGKALAANGLIE
ncbi:MAG: sensor histidine kinase [Salinigranum sp.]